MVRIIIVAVLLTAKGAVPAFDRHRSAWTALLKHPVFVVHNGTSPRVDFTVFQADRGELRAWLEGLSAVTRIGFRGCAARQVVSYPLLQG